MADPALSLLPVVARRRRPASLVLGAVLVGLVLGVAILSFVWTPYDPAQLNVRARLLPAGTPGYPLGTDKLGRDLLTHIIVGARNSLYVSIVATFIALLVGATIGLATAVASPRWQSLVTRAV